MTEYAQQALAILRDASQFKWYVIPLLAVVFYIYTVEVEKKNWSLVLAGLAFWGMDWFNEIWNALVFHFTDYAPVWGAPGNTAFLILIGLNIEITFMFAVSGIIWTKMLPADRKDQDPGHPQSGLHRRGWRALLRDHRDPAQCRQCPHLGIQLVERQRPLVDLPVRVPDLLRGGLLGIRHENNEEQADHRRHDLGEWLSYR